LNEQFAASRQEFEFGEEDENDILEPAPEISSFHPPSDVFEEDETDDLTDAEVNRLLRTNDNESADYYTLLGLPRDPAPTEAQIRAAYHRLSLAFHPDKQPPYLKDTAEMHFTRLRRAYETLIEPRKRVIYDLEGEEGVQNEYRKGGAMGPGGESERQISSVRVMNPKEFKKWFLGVMYGRERRAIEALVQHNTMLNIGVNARGNFDNQTSIISVDGNQERTIPSTRLWLQEVGIQSSFALPMPSLGRLLEAQIPSAKQVLHNREVDMDYDEEIESSDSWVNALGPSVPKLTISGGVSSQLAQAFTVSTVNASYDSSYNMTTEQIAIGAKLEHNFPEQVDTSASNSVASRLQGIHLEIEAAMLPHPASITFGLGKAMSFVSDTKPFYVYVATTVKDSPMQKPPEVEVNITRGLGLRGRPHCYLMWKSGEWLWPGPLDHRPAFLARWVSTGRTSTIMKLGAIWMPQKPSLNEDDPDGDPFELAPEGGTSGPTTNAALVARPGQVHLEVSHSIDLFTRYDEPPVRSRILNSGDALSSSPPVLRKSRGLRLELAASLGLPSVLDVSMTGKRRVGTFSVLGLGVGINQVMGLYCSLSWSRLGQNISVPITLLPLDETTTTAILCAVGVPWALYATLEFVVHRPAQRRRRKRLIKLQRAKLRSTIDERRKEAVQAVVLMYPSVAYRQEQEREAGGLVILSAFYGVRGSKPGSWKDGAVADVVVALAALVDDGQLSLARGLDKSRLIGFWDPSPLERKVLEIRYLFGGKEHRVEVRGNQGLVLPRREHEVVREG
jgi:DnaJ family protein C protein 11